MVCKTLRSFVRLCAAVCVFTCKFLALMQLPSEPEVGDLHIVILVQQYVLRLQIAMDNVLGVYVLDTLEYLSHDGACLLLRERYHRRQIVEELALGAQLEYEKYKCIRLEDVLQVNCEGMKNTEKVNTY